MKRILATCATLTLLLAISGLRGEEKPKYGKSEIVSGGSVQAPPTLPSKAPGHTTATTHTTDRDQVPAADPAMIQEITRLRAQIGNPLKGTVLDTGQSTPAAFADSLQRVIRELAPAPAISKKPTSSQKQAGQTSWPTNPPLLISRRRPSPVEVSKASGLVDSLRQSARLLDTRANDLEDRDAFEEADRLRKLANGLRSEARALRRGGTSPSPTVTREVQRYE